MNTSFQPSNPPKCTNLPARRSARVKYASVKRSASQPLKAAIAGDITNPKPAPDSAKPPNTTKSATVTDNDGTQRIGGFSMLKERRDTTQKDTAPRQESVQSKTTVPRPKDGRVPKSIQKAVSKVDLNTMPAPTTTEPKLDQTMLTNRDAPSKILLPTPASPVTGLRRSTRSHTAIPDIKIIKPTPPPPSQAKQNAKISGQKRKASSNTNPSNDRKKGIIETPTIPKPLPMSATGARRSTRINSPDDMAPEAVPVMPKADPVPPPLVEALAPRPNRRKNWNTIENQRRVSAPVRQPTETYEWL